MARRVVLKHTMSLNNEEHIVVKAILLYLNEDVSTTEWIGLGYQVTRGRYHIFAVPVVSVRFRSPSEDVLFRYHTICLLYQDLGVSTRTFQDLSGTNPVAKYQVLDVGAIHAVGTSHECLASAGAMFFRDIWIATNSIRKLIGQQALHLALVDTSVAIVR